MTTRRADPSAGMEAGTSRSARLFRETFLPKAVRTGTLDLKKLYVLGHVMSDSEVAHVAEFVGECPRVERVVMQLVRHSKDDASRAPILRALAGKARVYDLEFVKHPVDLTPTADAEHVTVDTGGVGVRDCEGIIRGAKGWRYLSISTSFGRERGRLEDVEYLAAGNPGLTHLDVLCRSWEAPAPGTASDATAASRVAALSIRSCESAPVGVPEELARLLFPEKGGGDGARRVYENWYHDGRRRIVKVERGHWD